MVTVQADPAATQPTAGPKSKARRPRELTPSQEGRRKKVVRDLNEPNVIAEDGPGLERTYYGVAEAFKPRNRWQEWLTARIATLMMRIDRSERVERKLRDWAAYRAFDFWDDDRELEALEIAGRLRRHPARSARQLRQIPAGIDWLAGRWRALAKLDPCAWTDDDRQHAADLLGGDDSVDPSTPGFAAARVDELEADRPRVEEADALLRGLVESDLVDAKVSGLAKLRREVRAWHRQLKWSADQFHVEHADRWDDPMRRPAHEKVTPDGFREVDYNHFEGPRRLEPLTPPAPPPAPAVEPASARVQRPVGESRLADALRRSEIDETNPTAPVAAGRLASAGADRGPSRAAKAGVLTHEQARRLKRSRRREESGRP